MHRELIGSCWWLAGVVSLAVILIVIVYFKAICPPVFC